MKVYVLSLFSLVGGVKIWETAEPDFIEREEI